MDKKKKILKPHGGKPGPSPKGSGFGTKGKKEREWELLDPGTASTWQLKLALIARTNTRDGDRDICMASHAELVKAATVKAKTLYFIPIDFADDDEQHPTSKITVAELKRLVFRIYPERLHKPRVADVLKSMPVVERVHGTEMRRLINRILPRLEKGLMIPSESFNVSTLQYLEKSFDGVSAISARDLARVLSTYKSEKHDAPVSKDKVLMATTGPWNTSFDVARQSAPKKLIDSFNEASADWYYPFTKICEFFGVVENSVMFAIFVHTHTLVDVYVIVAQLLGEKTPLTTVKYSVSSVVSAIVNRENIDDVIRLGPLYKGQGVYLWPPYCDSNYGKWQWGGVGDTFYASLNKRGVVHQPSPMSQAHSSKIFYLSGELGQEVKMPLFLNKTDLKTFVWVSGHPERACGRFPVTTEDGKVHLGFKYFIVRVEEGIAILREVIDKYTEVGRVVGKTHVPDRLLEVTEEGAKFRFPTSCKVDEENLSHVVYTTDLTGIQLLFLQFYLSMRSTVTTWVHAESVYGRLLQNTSTQVDFVSVVGIKMNGNVHFVFDPENKVHKVTKDSLENGSAGVVWNAEVLSRAMTGSDILSPQFSHNMSRMSGQVGAPLEKFERVGGAYDTIKKAFIFGLLLSCIVPSNCGSTYATYKDRAFETCTPVGYPTLEVTVPFMRFVSLVPVKFGYNITNFAGVGLGVDAGRYWVNPTSSFPSAGYYEYGAIANDSTPAPDTTTFWSSTAFPTTAQSQMMNMPIYRKDSFRVSMSGQFVNSPLSSCEPRDGGSWVVGPNYTGWTTVSCLYLVGERYVPHQVWSDSKVHLVLDLPTRIGTSVGFNYLNFDNLFVPSLLAATEKVFSHINDLAIYSTLTRMMANARFEIPRLQLCVTNVAKIMIVQQSSIIVCGGLSPRVDVGEEVTIVGDFGFHNGKSLGKVVKHVDGGVVFMDEPKSTNFKLAVDLVDVFVAHTPDGRCIIGDISTPADTTDYSVKFDYSMSIAALTLSVCNFFIFFVLFIFCVGRRKEVVNIARSMSRGALDMTWHNDVCDKPSALKRAQTFRPGGGNCNKVSLTSDNGVCTTDFTASQYDLSPPNA